MILCIKSDSKDVYIGIWDDGTEQKAKTWEAGRELSNQILDVIEELSKAADISTKDLQGVVVYEGPGSYTGLRISVSVANSIGYSYNIPVVGVTDTDWLKEGLKKISGEKGFKPLSPVYGGQVHTTTPKK